jgi:hypothetical protein
MLKNNNTVAEVLLALCVIMSSMLIFSGCNKLFEDDQDRINKTIEQLERHAPGCRALRLLRKATPQSLQTPTIVYARLVEQKKTVILLVKWIESAPSADSIGIRLPEKSSWKIYPLFAEEIELNKSEAERGFVLFTGGVAWEPDSDEWREISPAIRSGKCSAALFKDGRKYSHAQTIKYIKGPTLKMKTTDNLE